ncbi:MAG: FAD-dependent oxidoreductase [Alphaproteobacteria bacterium]|nr:FAD-dependent oxidoreductase [Alphaproteobacteria bacterium]
MTAMTELACDLAIIGAGAAGLSIAAGAAQLGAAVVLIERGAMGGDCLNVGCVPSKALLAAAHAAQRVRRAAALGVQVDGLRIDAAAVKAHVRRTIAAIAPVDSEERYRSLGATVLKAEARFISPTQLIAREASGQETRLTPRWTVVAAGLGPAIPPIPGLRDGPYLTNETVFQGDTLPSHLIILGGGAIGVELAEAHQLLGCQVTVIEAQRLLAREEAALVAPLREHLRAIGVTVNEGVAATAVGWADGVPTVTLADGQTVTGSHLLVATGRVAQLEGLGLEQAGIAWTPRGITVDRRLRTTNRRVFAAGDVAGGPQFTHVAGSHATTVILNTLFRVPSRANHNAVPRVVYTDPELAGVGLTEAEARATGVPTEVAQWSFQHNDRALADGTGEGSVRLILQRGRVVGVHILGPHAGELIAPWCRAVAERERLSRFARTMLPYPTLSEAPKRAAGEYLSRSLFSPRVRWLVRLLARLP